MKLLLKWIVMTIAVLITAYLLERGVTVDSFWAAIVTALVLGLINAVVRPILLVLTLPLTIVSLGLFIFVLNAFLVLLTSSIVPGFHVLSFWWALLFSLVLSLVSFVLNRIIPV
ncbi:MAG TPA: phage holin family protein [Deltaproteobacteria bacterium]|jgi:putative membrane protein|nr:phage holin family protein [Deltaproteobacteria bacterium]HOI06179.1 phage holin family protein [Deltaproteobacteria bacterium]